MASVEPSLKCILNATC